MKKAIIKYLIAFIAASSIAFLTFYFREGFETTDEKTLTMYIADALTVPGVVFVMIWFLCWFSNEGSLDGLLYVFKRMFKALLPFGRKEEETYEQFKYNRKKVSGYSFLLVTGILFLVGMGIFLIKYYSL